MNDRILVELYHSEHIRCSILHLIRFILPHDYKIILSHLQYDIIYRILVELWKSEHVGCLFIVVNVPYISHWRSSVSRSSYRYVCCYVNLNYFVWSQVAAAGVSEQNNKKATRMSGHPDTFNVTQDLYSRADLELTIFCWYTQRVYCFYSDPDAGLKMTL